MFAKIANGELFLNQNLLECNSVKTKYNAIFFISDINVVTLFWFLLLMLRGSMIRAPTTLTLLV